MKLILSPVFLSNPTAKYFQTDRYDPVVLIFLGGFRKSVFTILKS